MFTRCFKLFFFLAFFVSIAGCSFQNSYIGKYVERSRPHSIYANAPIYDNIVFQNSNAGYVNINYSFVQCEDGTYEIKGVMSPDHSTSNVVEVDLYLLLINKGIVVDAVRMNANPSWRGNSFEFSKKFTSHVEFRALTFAYLYRYML